MGKQLPRKALALFFCLFFSACAPLAPAPSKIVAAKINQTESPGFFHKRFPTATATPTFTPTPTTTPTPTLTSTPTATPPPHPIFITNLEVVTVNAASGNDGNAWGGHQTRIVRTKDGVFTAYVTPGDSFKKKRWRLAWRNEAGGWKVVAKGIAGREPVNLLASPDGTLHIIGWPNGESTIWSGKPKNGELVMESSPVPGLVIGYFPYNSAGIDSDGNLCVLSSTGHKPGEFLWACYNQSTRQWTSQSSALNYRFTYSYLFPNEKGGLSIVSTRDVKWEILEYQKPGSFSYVFNAITYWRTNDLVSKPIRALDFIEEPPNNNYPYVRLSAQMDVYIDTRNRVHILYKLEGPSTGGKEEERHRVLSANGDVLHDVKLPKRGGKYFRIFQDKQERLYIIGSAGFLYPVAKDGVTLDKPIRFDLEGYQVEWSGFGLSVPRTGTPLSDTMEVVFPTEGGSKWIYFRIHLLKE